MAGRAIRLARVEVAHVILLAEIRSKILLKRKERMRLSTLKMRTSKADFPSPTSTPRKSGKT
jgi:hypothetical protein